ncbi:hypothetical protein WIV_gp184 [Wiseana iridescent virus]|uniref:Uncharacterized protein n=1 Tax=Wiseana iridescent virus TaxID=68347 RepID=G0T5L0_IRV9|nr:hypothetical protein WIV_gp184 [Wiseana iridescent virus]ADO00528.1 hypothetical protein [Wiseana iridescent virus]
MSGSHNIKLTLEQRQKLVRMHSEGTTVVDLAEQFGVSRPTVYNVLEKMGKTNHKKIDFYVDKKSENKEEMNPSPTILDEIKTTNFLGITIDTEGGTSNPKIRKTLDKSFKLLDVVEFVKVTKFKLNTVMFDYFWQVVVGKSRLHVSTAVLEWFGYLGEYRKQKEAFLKILRRNEISYRELTKKDKEIELYPTIKEELQTVNEGAQACSKFLIMEPDDLKMAIMQLKTKNGHTIRQYYIDLEKLLKMYTEYTLYFNHREAQRKITGLEEMMVKMDLERKQEREVDRQLILRQEQYMRSLGISLEEVKDQNEELLDNNKGLKKNVKGLRSEVKDVKRKLGIAVEDRAPLPVDEEIQERFVLIKRNDEQHYQYYTIRAQHGYTERRIKIQRVLFPQLEILLDFKANPNSKSLYNRIKKELKIKSVQFSGNNIDLEGSEVIEEELIEEMKVINDQKYNI